ncbi:MAG: hypothetical protein U0074_24465 [Kouleothrix sp.]
MSKRFDAIYNGHRPVKQQILWLGNARIWNGWPLPGGVRFPSGREPVKLSAEANGSGYMRLAGRRNPA